MKHLPTVLSQVITHAAQEYDTAGNYWEVFDIWHLQVSECSDWRHEALIMLHEFVEMCLTKNDGVDWKDIDKFDMEGPGKDMNDPGSSTEAPYHNQHLLAEAMERKFATMLGVDWDKYNADLDSLEYKS